MHPREHSSNMSDNAQLQGVLASPACEYLKIVSMDTDICFDSLRILGIRSNGQTPHVKEALKEPHKPQVISQYKLNK